MNTYKKIITHLFVMSFFSFGMWQLNNYIKKIFLNNNTFINFLSGLHNNNIIAEKRFSKKNKKYIIITFNQKTFKIFYSKSNLIAIQKNLLLSKRKIYIKDISYKDNNFYIQMENNSISKFFKKNYIQKLNNEIQQKIGKNKKERYTSKRFKRKNSIIIKLNEKIYRY